MSRLKSPAFSWAIAGILAIALAVIAARVREQERALALSVAEANLKSASSETSEPVSSDELAQLRGVTKELPRLRNEIDQLRKAVATLRDSPAADPEAGALQATAQELATRKEELVTVRQRATCVQNLERIHQAKQQWAAKNTDFQDSAVTMQDLAAFLEEAPSCPEGGVYKPNRAGSRSQAPPMCSIHGAMLPE